MSTTANVISASSVSGVPNHARGEPLVMRELFEKITITNPCEERKLSDLKRPVSAGQSSNREYIDRMACDSNLSPEYFHTTSVGQKERDGPLHTYGGGNTEGTRIGVMEKQISVADILSSITSRITALEVASRQSKDHQLMIAADIASVPVIGIEYAKPSAERAEELDEWKFFNNYAYNMSTNTLRAGKFRMCIHYSESKYRVVNTFAQMMNLSYVKLQIDDRSPQYVFVPAIAKYVNRKIKPNKYCSHSDKKFIDCLPAVCEYVIPTAIEEFCNKYDTTKTYYVLFDIDSSFEEYSMYIRADCIKAELPKLMATYHV